MKRRSLLWPVAAIYAVAVAVLGQGVSFLAREAPEIIRNERRRVVNEYRQCALELKEQRAGRKPVRPDREWKTVGKMAPGRWGFVDRGATVLVWFRIGDEAWSMECERIAETDYRRILYWGGGAFLLLFLGLAWFGASTLASHAQNRDNYLAAAAHDLMTPLAELQVLIGMDDASARLVVERMTKIVDSIGDFIMLGDRRPVKKDFDLVAAWREAYRLFAEDFEDEASGPIALEAPESLTVTADETMTVQILWNLIGNELKYSAGHGPISARISSGTGGAVVEIVDSGPGMSAKERRHAFDRHYRAKTILKCGKGGFGLGLCTAREFARRQGGDLKVLSEGSGSRFIFTVRESIT